MAFLNGLPERFGSLIRALDALGDEKTFTFEFVKSRLLQEEQRNKKRFEDSLKKSSDKVLVPTQSRANCPSCSSRKTRKCLKC